MASPVGYTARRMTTPQSRTLELASAVVDVLATSGAGEPEQRAALRVAEELLRVEALVAIDAPATSSRSASASD
jgi:hypothetical protein